MFNTFTTREVFMKRTAKLILSALFVLATALPVFAQDSDNNNWDSNSTALGTAVTLLPEHTIYGLNYQHWWNNFGLDWTIGGHYNKSWTGNPESYICAGIKPMFQVYNTDPSNKHMAKVYIWGLVGGTGSISSKNVYSDDPPYNLISSTPDNKFDVTAGFGFGVEVICWNHLSIPVEVGFAGGFPNDPAFGFCGSTGLRFRF